MYFRSVYPRKAFFKASAIILIATLALQCSKKEDDEFEDPLLGNWESACGRMFSDAQVVAECGSPTDESCEEKYQLYYYKIKASFKEAGDVSEDAQHPQLTYTITSYYHEEKATAKKCASANKVATAVTVKNYQLQSSPILEANAVNTDNSYPEGASPINLQTVSFKRTYYDEDLTDQLNSLNVCENDGWAADKAYDITGKENCSANLFALTDRYLTHPDGLTDWDYDIEGNWESPFQVGVEEYSIYKVDSSTEPKTLNLGVTPIDTKGSWEDADVKKAEKINGTSDYSRHKKLGGAFEFIE